MSTSDTKIVPNGSDRFDIDVNQSSGLSLRVRGGVLLTGLGYSNVPNKTLTLTASTANYVEMDDAGVISTNTTSFTAGYTTLYVVTTNATQVTGIVDARGGATVFPLAEYPIAPYNVRGPTGLAITATELAGGFNFNLASNVLLLQGEVTNNETEASVGNFQFVLPKEYVAGGAIKFRVKAANLGAGTQTSCTITVTAYKSDGNGAVGSNLGPAAQTHAAKTTWYTKDFIITATGLAAGDALNIVLTVSNIESASSNLVWTAEGLSMLLDVAAR
jgi:hypothetical protein